jgi:ATP-dependent DNA ligase
MIHRVIMSAPKSFSFEPMLCESAERLPEGDEWRYELKLDGFRAIGRKSGRSAQLWSRNQKDFTRRFPDVVKGIAELPSDTVIDGEVVALDENGRPSFNLPQGV